MYAKLGDVIYCVLNHPPGSWIERPTEVQCTLSTPEAVGYANEELLPSGRWSVVPPDVPQCGDKQ